MQVKALERRSSWIRTGALVREMEKGRHVEMERGVTDLKPRNACAQLRLEGSGRPLPDFRLLASRTERINCCLKPVLEATS